MEQKVGSLGIQCPLLAVLVICMGLNWVFSGTAHAQEEYAKDLQRGTYARAIELSAPTFPLFEQKRAHQGWVELSYVVTVDGAVIDPIIQDSSGSRHFEKAARRAVTKWKFKPATWMGEPVEQCHNKVIVSFAMEDTPLGASRRFVSRYKKIDKEIERGNLENAKDQIGAMFQSSQLTVYEVARLWLLNGELAKAMDDKSTQLSSYRKAIVASGQWLEDGVYVSVLQSIVILELKLGKYSSALRNFEKLSKLSTEPGQFSKLSKYIVSVEDQIASDKIIAVQASLRADRQCEDCSADWQYRPMRRKFSITNIKGNLSSLEIRCDWRRVVDTIKEDVDWAIPESWGKCSIMVFGEKGASFSFLELPDSA